MRNPQLYVSGKRPQIYWAGGLAVEAKRQPVVRCPFVKVFPKSRYIQQMTLWYNTLLQEFSLLNCSGVELFKSIYIYIFIVINILNVAEESLCVPLFSISYHAINFLSRCVTIGTTNAVTLEKYFVMFGMDAKVLRTRSLHMSHILSAMWSPLIHMGVISREIILIPITKMCWKITHEK